MAHQALSLSELVEPRGIFSAEVRRESTSCQVLEFQPQHRSAAPHSAHFASPATVEDRPETAAPCPSQALRRCEDHFFAFSFPELIASSTNLIHQHSTYGDAYAFRCFASLGEIQMGSTSSLDYELADLLRDYFASCERPIATEGGTVCRLFLKLVFGDLVKRISRANHGSRCSLDKADPLCGGAFAFLEGDFRTARWNFDEALSDPHNRSWGLVGIGLLNVLHSDLQGARAAFARAGAIDDDIIAMCNLLRHTA